MLSPTSRSWPRRATVGRRYLWPGSCSPMCACSTSGCPSLTGWGRPARWPGRASKIRSRWWSSRRSTSTSTCTARSKAGARGFLLKDAGPELLSQAVHAAANGEALIAPRVTVRLLAAFADLRTSEPLRQPIEPLTTREEEVMVTVARGLTNAEIASELHISLSPVKSHLASLMNKLGARNRVEIAMWAYEAKRIKASCLSKV